MEFTIVIVGACLAILGWTFWKIRRTRVLRASILRDLEQSECEVQADLRLRREQLRGPHVHVFPAGEKTYWTDGLSARKD